MFGDFSGDNMDTRLNLRLLIRSSGVWIAVIAVPLAVNLFLWKALVVPQRNQLLTWQNEQRLTELKPKLAALVSESDAMLNHLDRTSLHDDPSEAMQVLQRLADRHRLQLKELSAQGAQAKGKADSRAGGSSVPVSVRVSGRFSKLAHWLSDVEGCTGLRVDSWTLEPGKEPGEPHQLNVQLSALVGGA